MSTARGRPAASRACSAGASRGGVLSTTPVRGAPPCALACGPRALFCANVRYKPQGRGPASSRRAASDRESEVWVNDSNSPGAAPAQEQSDEEATSSSRARMGLLADSSFVRKFSMAGDIDEALDLVYSALERANRNTFEAISSEECDELLQVCLERGNHDLVMAIYDAMCQAGLGGTVRATSGSWIWPAASLDTVCLIAVGLAKSLQVEDALRIVASVQQRGLPQASDEVSFGRIINCPLKPEQPLAVVRPQEGDSVVACSETRYEFELFSGDVAVVDSEALNVAPNALLGALRALGLFKGAKGPAAAIHEITVYAPYGGAKTFRCATSTKDVPAAVGERVTVVLSPDADAPKSTRRLLSTRPPGTRPGEALQITNHVTGTTLPLLRPPPSTGESGLPGWAVPATVLLASGDAASSLIDPTLPALIAGGALLTAGSIAVTSQYVYPELKRLPEKAVTAASVRQQLLKDHNILQGKVQELTADASDLVRSLARLAQLQAKMGAVGGSGEYEVRITRVREARSAAAEQLRSALVLLDGYATVMKRIEIEVDIDADVPEGEASAIAAQIEALSEVESLQAEWKLAAEARDEVEKLLKMP